MSYTKRRKRVTRIFVGLAAVLLIVVVALLLESRMPPLPSLPQPNGYDDILRAGSLVTETTNDYRALPEPQLRQLVITNATALQILRVGLSRECRVPLENWRDYNEQHISQLSDIRRLVLALAAEGELAELDKRTNDAAYSYLDAIRLGQEMARGGLLIDGMVGEVCESIGASKLAAIVSGLNAEQCRRVIKELELITARRQPAREILQNERKWSYHKYGLLERLGSVIATRSWNPVRNNYNKYVARREAEFVRQSQLLLDLAVRAYEFEKGRSPTNLSELVPEYLTKVPPQSATQSR